MGHQSFRIIGRRGFLLGVFFILFFDLGGLYFSLEARSFFTFLFDLWTILFHISLFVAVEATSLFLSLLCFFSGKGCVYFDCIDVHCIWMSPPWCMFLEWLVLFFGFLYVSSFSLFWFFGSIRLFIWFVWSQFHLHVPESLYCCSSCSLPFVQGVW